MERGLIQLYRFLVTYWNSIAAAVSVVGYLVFSLVPALQHYAQAFVFLGANAVIWTLIEIKASMRPGRSHRGIFRSMHVARPSIVRDIKSKLDDTTATRPLELVLLGGRLRSMSDIVREVYDELRMHRTQGHLHVSLYCMEPGYIARRVLPGDTSAKRQQERNASVAEAVRSLARELTSLNGKVGNGSSVMVQVYWYTEDPHFYAYLLDDSIIYVGNFTWSRERADFLAEGPCYRLGRLDQSFHPIRAWLLSRAGLYAEESRANRLGRTTDPVGGDT